MTEAAVRVATAEEGPEVGRIMSAAFQADPVFAWVFDGPGRPQKIDALFGFMAVETHLVDGTVWITDGACAAWTPPDVADWPDERGEKMRKLLEARCEPRDIERLGHLDARCSEAHPSDPHWYLGVIATEPAAQGSGLGAMLLAHSLDQIDPDGLPAYLEATSPRSARLYQRLGFEPHGEISLGDDAPTLYPMLRPPR